MSESLSILLVDNEESVLETIGAYLHDLGHNIEKIKDGNIALQRINTKTYDMVLADVFIPEIDGLTLLSKIQEVRQEISVIILSKHSDMDIVIQALRLGATDFLLKPIKLEELDYALEKIISRRSLRKETRRFSETLKNVQSCRVLNAKYPAMVAASSSMKKIEEQIAEVVRCDIDTILITGETGTGKEVVATRIHAQSHIPESPFIAVSCPVLSDSLMESELFGHIKGSFTGAISDREGYFEMAHNGTLFLDEVADLSPKAQGALLRVLETRTFRRIGASREISVNVRVITATNACLEKAISEGRFRRDLFYRLNLYSIKILPLRERKDDILPLAEYFLTCYTKYHNRPKLFFSQESRESLYKYDFPGNVRELKNIVERAAMITPGECISPEQLGFLQTQNNLYHLNEIRMEDERLLMLKALEKNKWNLRQVANDLNIPYSSLRYKLKKWRIEKS